VGNGGKTASKKLGPPQIQVYSSILRDQINQETRTNEARFIKPDVLPIAQQIEFYIARFPDVRGEQNFEPGICVTVSPRGNQKGMEASNAVVKLGRPAIPMLIEHLNDQRLTRSVDITRGIRYNHYTVLRVQDVALQCLEVILNKRLLPPDQSYISTAQPQLQKQIIRNIKT
jgi:hypothetical protein